ncbi:MAG: hypothetical protein Q9169_008024, partial [Polycauliona sp. 2 TL-2023]
MGTILHTARLTLARSHQLLISRCKLQVSHASSTIATKHIDFHALEAKWKAEWAAKEHKHDKRRLYRPLAPLRFSMLGVRKPYGNEGKVQVKTRPPQDDEYLFDRLLPFAMPTDSDEFLDLCESDEQLKLCIANSGLDLARTSIIFDDPENCDLRRKNAG